VADASVARALLPERAWHAVLVDHGAGEAAMRDLTEAALSHAAHRIAMVTPAARHELQPATMAAFTGYLVKPLRAASLAARLTVPTAQLVDSDETNEAPIVPAIPAPDLSRPGLSILVAEDNEINALLIRSLLKRLGHQAVVTTDGEAALESWIAADSAGAPYDVVLMDVQMPKLDGIEATRRIRAREAGRGALRTAILALTANTLVDDRYACFEAGMDGFLVKPLDRDKLADALADVAAARTVAA
jgi:CheY-like chemotaxis protein